LLAKRRLRGDRGPVEVCSDATDIDRRNIGKVKGLWHASSKRRLRPFYLLSLYTTHTQLLQEFSQTSFANIIDFFFQRSSHTHFLSLSLATVLYSSLASSLLYSGVISQSSLCLFPISISYLSLDMATKKTLFSA
jgi:hypothetical protein